MSVETSPDIQGHARLCGCAACRAGGTTASAPEPQGSVITTNISGGGNVSFVTDPYYVTSLLPSDEYRWNYNAPGTGLTLTYGFMTTMPWYAQWSGGNNPNWFGNEWGTFVPFTAAQRAAVDRAIQNYEDVCDVDFVYQANGDSATVRFGSAAMYPDEAAHAYYPQRSENGDWEGDVWFNHSVSDTATQTPGSYGYFVTLHEIGHTLGLKHPHDWQQGGTTLPYMEDNRQYTVMSYQGHPNYGLEPSSLLLYDIAALQYLYGANMATRSGDTTYTWAANEQFISCIWDGGGIDTIDASNQSRRVIVDLRPGLFSSIGSNAGGNALNNLSIAFDVTIENAIGGSGNDELIGNAAANRLEGGGGNDTLAGGAGADTLVGGAGVDTASYEYGAAVNLNFATGVHAGDAAGDQFAGIEQFRGSGGDDTFVGSAGADTFIGGDGNDMLEGRAGADRLEGGAGTDFVSYAASASGVSVNLQTGAASGGDASGDVLASFESIIGSAFDDTLVGSASGGRLEGGGGNDSLDGRLGWYTLVGGIGNDIYYTDGIDSILESAGQGTDEIRTTASSYSLDSDIENLTYVGSGGFNGIGNHAANIIVGGTGNDQLAGSGGADTLMGGGGDDVFTVDGSDTVDGGAGYDTVSYQYSGPTNIDLAAGTGDTFISIEAFTGSQYYADTLRGDGNDNTFTGLGGNDTIDGRGGYDTAVYAGLASDYIVTVNQDGSTTIQARRWSLQSQDGTDTLYGIENIRFAGTALNRAPVISGPATWNSVFRNQMALFTPLLNISDADGDWIEWLEVRELTAGAGQLVLDGVAQAAGQWISLDRNYTGLMYRAAATPGTADRFEVRVFDGVAWSSVSTVSLAAVNHVPVIGTGYVPTPRGTTFVRAQDLFVVVDSDDASMVRYEFQDVTPGHGYFRLNGVAITTPLFQVDANDFANLQFVPSATPGAFDLIRIRAYDGYDWSIANSVSVVGPPNTIPVAVAANRVVPRGSSFIAASSLVSATDGDGDPIATYHFKDWGTSAASGYFTVNGVRQAAGADILVSAADLANTRFVLGTVSDQLEVRVSDGLAWSSWRTFTVTPPTNRAPTVTVSNLMPAHGTVSLAASDLFDVSDADGDAMTQYWFYDSTVGNGRLRLNGVDLAERTPLTPIDASDLANLEFITSADGPNLLWVQAYDGYEWSAWKSFTVDAVQNAAPVVNVRTISPGRNDASIAGSDLWASITDADGDAMTQYWFYDSTVGNGRLRLSGVDLAERTPLTPISAADLANLEFITSADGPNLLWVQAYDGYEWSAWKSFTVNAVQNAAPTVTVLNRHPAHGELTIAADALFDVADADGDAITQYWFYDGTVGNGRLRLGGVDLAERTPLTPINASDLSNLEFVTSGAGPNLLWVQAYDGTTWSAWKSFTVNAVPNAAPTLASISQSAPRNTTLAVADLFMSAQDPDGDPIVLYRFWDSTTTAGSGSFKVDGEIKSAKTAVDVMASQLASAEFVTGSAPGTDLLWVTAYDGVSWSESKSLQLTTLAST